MRPVEDLFLGKRSRVQQDAVPDVTKQGMKEPAVKIKIQT